MKEKIPTEVGDNWVTFFFECSPSDFKRILIDLFSLIKKITDAEIPHFLIREYVPTRHLGISLRILRKQTKSKEIDDKLCKFFEKHNIQYQKEPEANRHAWLRKGQVDSYWSRKRCEAIHKLSDFAVFMAKNDLFDTDSKCLNAHYLVNMLALQEATVPQSNQVCFLDIVAGKALTFQTFQLGT